MKTSLFLGKPARLRYLDGRFEILQPGRYVRCAVSGEPIALEALCYWSVERQEAYASAAAALQAWQQHARK